MEETWIALKIFRLLLKWRNREKKKSWRKWIEVTVRWLLFHCMLLLKRYRISRNSLQPKSFCLCVRIFSTSECSVTYSTIFTGKECLLWFSNWFLHVKFFSFSVDFQQQTAKIIIHVEISSLFTGLTFFFAHAITSTSTPGLHRIIFFFFVFIRMNKLFLLSVKCLTLPLCLWAYKREMHERKIKIFGRFFSSVGWFSFTSI